MRWPESSRLRRVSDKHHLVMFAHPRCPCTRASIGELALIMARVHGRLTADVLFVKPRELGFTRDPAPARVHQEPPRPPGTTLREMERWMILETLKRLEGNRTHAARELGISLRTLRNKINEYQIFDPATLPRTRTVRAPAVSRRDGQISPTAL